MCGASRNQHGKGGLDQTLGRALGQYRHHPELVYPFLLFGVVSLLLEFRFELLWELFDFEPSVGVSVDPTPVRDLVSDSLAETVTPVLEEVFVLLVLGVAFLFGLTFLVFLFAAGVAFLVVADEQENRTRRQFARAVVVLRRLPALFAASLIASVLIVAGSLLFVLPGLYLMAKLALGGPAIVVDRQGPVSGLRTAWRRSSGQLFEVSAIVIGGAVVISLVGFVPLVGEAISVLVLLPVTMLALASLYVEAPSTTGSAGA